MCPLARTAGDVRPASGRRRSAGLRQSALPSSGMDSLLEQLCGGSRDKFVVTADWYLRGCLFPGRCVAEATALVGSPSQRHRQQRFPCRALLPPSWSSLPPNASSGSFALDPALALRTGTATYRATGRPNANTRLTLIDTFLQYRTMQYQDSCLFLFYYILYRSANMGLAGALPMATIIFACVCWLIVPTLFAPYPTWKNLCEAVRSSVAVDFSDEELEMWITLSASGNKPAQDVPKAGSKGQPGNLFEVLLQAALEQDTRFNYRFTDDCYLAAMARVDD
ncbi:hypothetical protein AK812_SmicGene31010 [Symbiodinium microadriaticum]|uniref:Uncharacterized protein n=1 Tax=Symbiodinium microadriaticum TaxID=2951 RepID=A0A1Q9CXV2_SYMMI|nr:hypothetical protein AK812_SmicGene31010 [Symbiodinium microadriaticum]